MGELLNRRNAIQKVIFGVGGVIGQQVCTGCMGRLSHVEKKPLGDFSLKDGHQNSKVESLQEKSSPVETRTTIENPSYSQKMQRFDDVHSEDVFVLEPQKILFQSVQRKLKKIMNYIGYGNFNLIGFESALKYARHVGRLESFTKQEQEFMEELFHTDAKTYGFLGARLAGQLTQRAPARDTVKIPFSGHYLFRDTAYPIYQRIVKDVGDSVVLTSGIRSVMKQLHLFIEKTISVDYNLSRASRSLAPPGYSYHGVGDFDIGKKGFGLSNFTDEFSQTKEYKKLAELGYIDIRYPNQNPFGVRFEPWHIEGALRV